MTEHERRYHLRITERFGFYVSNQWHQWQAGDTVTEPILITTLESLGAPVQRIPTEFKR
jgi:hypothetical protein